MNGFDEEKYKSEVNRLGMNAVNAKGTEDFTMALEKLKSYFIKGYPLYAYQKQGVKLNFKADETISETQKLNNAEASIDFALKKYEKILKSKVEKFDPAKQSKYENSFFAFVISDFNLGAEKEASRQYYSENRCGITEYLTDREMRIIGHIKKLLDSMDMKDVFSTVAEKDHKNEEEIRKIWGIYNTVFFSINEEIDDGTKEELIPDKSVNISEALEQEDGTRRKLLILNRIYHDSFMEKHKKAYPPYFTNEFIKSWVKYIQKTNHSFERTVKEQWDMLDFAYKRSLYTEAEYYCIREFVYDLFDEIRREILNKELAEKIGMSAPNFTKTVNAAKKIIEKSLEK